MQVAKDGTRPIVLKNSPIEVQARFSRVLLPLTGARERFVERSERSNFRDAIALRTGASFSTLSTRLSHSVSTNARPLSRRYETFACSAVTIISSCQEDGNHPFSRATATQPDNGPSCRRPC